MSADPSELEIIDGGTSDAQAVENATASDVQAVSDAQRRDFGDGGGAPPQSEPLVTRRRERGETVLDQAIEPAAGVADTISALVPGLRQGDKVQQTEEALETLAQTQREGRGALPSREQARSFVDDLGDVPGSDPVAGPSGVPTAAPAPTPGFLRGFAGRGAQIANPAAAALGAGRLGEQAGEFAFDAARGGLEVQPAVQVAQEAGVVPEGEPAQERAEEDIERAISAGGAVAQRTVESVQRRPEEAVGAGAAEVIAAVAGGGTTRAASSGRLGRTAQVASRPFTRASTFDDGSTTSRQIARARQRLERIREADERGQADLSRVLGRREGPGGTTRRRGGEGATITAEDIAPGRGVPRPARASEPEVSDFGERATRRGLLEEGAEGRMQSLAGEPRTGTQAATAGEVAGRGDVVGPVAGRAGAAQEQQVALDEFELGGFEGGLEDVDGSEQARAEGVAERERERVETAQEPGVRPREDDMATQRDRERVDSTLRERERERERGRERAAVRGRQRSETEARQRQRQRARQRTRQRQRPRDGERRRQAPRGDGAPERAPRRRFDGGDDDEGDVFEFLDERGPLLESEEREFQAIDPTEIGRVIEQEFDE